MLSRHGNGGLTIYEAAWAYCDGAGADDRHLWSETGGVPLESLVRWTAPNGNGHVNGNGNGDGGAPTKAHPDASERTSRKPVGVRRT